jgi:Arc/MetJ family transcription regulator
MALQRVVGMALQRVVGMALQRVVGMALQRVVGMALQRVVGMALQRVVGMALQRVDGMALQRVVGMALQRDVIKAPQFIFIFRRFRHHGCFVVLSPWLLCRFVTSYTANIITDNICRHNLPHSYDVNLRNIITVPP